MIIICLHSSRGHYFTPYAVRFNETRYNSILFDRKKHLESHQPVQYLYFVAVAVAVAVAYVTRRWLDAPPTMIIDVIL
jgi:hypothetical protein